MKKLRKKATFEENLQILLDSVQESDVGGFLRNNEGLVRRLASESSQESRSGLVAGIQDLIDQRLETSEADE